MSIPLPPTGIHPEEFVFMSDAQLRARDQEIVRCVLQAAAKVCEDKAKAAAEMRSRLMDSDHHRHETTRVCNVIENTSSNCVHLIRALEFHHE